MNENAKKWVARLATGRDPQTKDFLHSKTGFCCLGVACQLYAEERPEAKLEWRWSDYYGAYTLYLDGQAYGSAILPSEVKDWLGLRTSNGEYIKNGDDHTLTDDNDSGKTFPEIAAIIREHETEIFKA